MEILKETFQRPKRLACCRSVSSQSQAVWKAKASKLSSEHSSQVFVAMREVVEDFVLDLPAGSGASGDLYHILCRDWQAGQESAVVGDFSFYDR